MTVGSGTNRSRHPANTRGGTRQNFGPRFDPNTSRHLVGMPASTERERWRSPRRSVPEPLSARKPSCPHETTSRGKNTRAPDHRSHADRSDQRLGLRCARNRYIGLLRANSDDCPADRCFDHRFNHRADLRTDRRTDLPGDMAGLDRGTPHAPTSRWSPPRLWGVGAPTLR